MGKIQYIKFQVVYHIRDASDVLFVIKSIENIPAFNPHIHIFWFPYSILEKTDYKIIGNTECIEEKLHESEKVRIDNEELTVEKIVQCDNGDVICYVDKVIKKIEDHKTYENSKMILNEIMARMKRYEEDVELQNKIKKRKWWKIF